MFNYTLEIRKQVIKNTNYLYNATELISDKAESQPHIFVIPESPHPPESQMTQFMHLMWSDDPG